MKKFFKLILIAVCFTLAISFINVNQSEASVVSSSQTSSISSDFLQFVKVQEGNKTYVYIYTDGGIFISKFEEL